MKRAACLWLHRPADGQVLAVTRRLGTNLCLPGGKCDEGESFAAAAVRETFEETGVRVPETNLVLVHTGPCESYPGGPADFEVAAYLADWDVAYGPVIQQEPGIEPCWVSAIELVKRSAMPVYNRILRTEVLRHLNART